MGRNCKLKRSSLKQIVVLIYVIVLFSGCAKHGDKYGIEFNETRKQIGLSPLPENWKSREIFGVPNPTKEWSNPQKDSIPSYSKKVISYNKDTILEEVNNYIGPNNIKTIDGGFKDLLSIRYSFVDKKKPWKFTLLTSDNSLNDLGYESVCLIEITKQQADSVLISWDLRK